MKLNMFLGALVVSVGLCGQSFGFELLDRMLGLNSYGGGCCEQSCCEQTCAAEPACGHQAEPACGCEVEQSCGCGHQHRCHDLFGGLRGLFHCHRCKSACGGCQVEQSCGCDAEPACGCEAAPSCCGRRHRGLLHHLFAHKRHCGHQSACSSCDSGCSSCEGGMVNGGGYDQNAPTPAAPGAEGGDAAPMPPAPMADPSASLRNHNRIFQASKYVRTR